MSGWSALVALAERELDLARAGEGEALLAAMDERDRLAATLGQAPASARPELERLAVLQQQLTVEIALARDAAARELASLGRGRGAVRGYKSAAGGAVRTVDAASL